MLWDLLINLTTLATFLPCHENLTLLAYTFSIRCILRDLTGKWYCHRWRFLIFFQGPYKCLLSLKFDLLTVTGRATNTFPTETFGWTEFTLKSRILLKKMPYDRHKAHKELRAIKILELVLKMTKSRFAILITTKKTELSIGFWLLENKNQQVK